MVLETPFRGLGDGLVFWYNFYAIKAFNQLLPMPAETTGSLFDFIKRNTRPAKPRTSGITEMRGPYYTVMGTRYLNDVLETAGQYVDSLKFAGGSFVLLPDRSLREMIECAHAHGVTVSTGGFIEYVITQGRDAVLQYVDKCKQAGFDIIEISSGFITLTVDDWLRLIDAVHKKGLRAKPEVGIQFGAGGSTPAEELKMQGNRDVGYAIKLAKRFLDEGVDMIMVESEGITENVGAFRTEVIAQFVDDLPLAKLMFEAADPAVFEWYIRNYGNDVNLFVDHSQVLQLECLRSGIWGTSGTWGRIQGW